MASYNKVILVGNLTRDPQLSYLPSQTPVCEFGLAVNERWKDKQTGEQRESVCFVDCRLYGRQAETFNQYVFKGHSVLVEGRLQFDTWEGQDGSRRSKHLINVQTFQFLTPRGAAQQARPAPGQAPVPAREPEPEPMAHEEPHTPPPSPPDDDIPF